MMMMMTIIYLIVVVLFWLSTFTLSSCNIHCPISCLFRWKHLHCCMTSVWWVGLGYEYSNVRGSGWTHNHVYVTVTNPCHNQVTASSAIRVGLQHECHTTRPTTNLLQPQSALDLARSRQTPNVGYHAINPAVLPYSAHYLSLKLAVQ